ncbi:MAG: Ig-like domain-containing domain, partial [Desulfobulbaceae bacterium]
GGGGTGCVECHGHDVGTLYDPDMSTPYSAGSAASLGRGTVQSHSTHTETDSDDAKGPGLYCDSCHDITNFPNFKSGTDSNGDGRYSLSETDVCNTCHSPGGTYDGLDDPVIGAKAIWRTGAYVATNDSTLRTGKEKWCATCHDEEPSIIKGVAAPNVIGDEDGIYAYGTGWGYYKTGHGLATGVYAASEAPAASQQCSGCHDYANAHIDGEHRTYNAAADNYQVGYRLKYSMDIPRSQEDADDFPLCFACHGSDPYLVQSDYTTNFRSSTPTNGHWKHLLNMRPSNDWDSDGDGVGDSRISCPACHNVHGSPSPRMVRHGELISTPGTTDKVPALDLQYTPAGTYPTLLESTGGVTHSYGSGGGSIAKNHICNMCHNDSYTYTRTPNDMYPPKIAAVYGRISGGDLAVIFTKPVYTDPGASGGLLPADFALTDVDNSRTITGVSHQAGDDVAILTLSATLDAVEDLGVDTVAAATAASIYDATSKAMGTTQVPVTGDAAAPVLTGINPANGATDIAIDSNLTFTLADSGAGVDWSSFEIQLSGDQGYAKTYTDLDTAIVAKTGSMTSYSVSVNPDANFSTAEVITVTVQVSDHVGNALTPPAWTFTTQATSTPQTMTIHPSGLAAEGGGGFTPTGGDWADVLDSNDSDISYVYRCCTSASTFYVDMDDPGIGGATINSVTIKVVVKNSAANNVNIGYKTGTATIWKGDTSVGTSYTTLTLAAPADSDGGAWSLTDLNNLRVAVRRNYTGPTGCTVTEVAVEIDYTP